MAARLDGRGSGQGELLSWRALVRGRLRDSASRKRMVLDERGSYNKLEKRPADAGLFISFGGGEHGDYFCPCSILHREGVGRSWAMNNTSNIPGVE